jgi:hypothetical protein
MDIVKLPECNVTYAENQPESKRNWMFYAEDENGDGMYLQDWYFTGTYEEACHYADTKADEWVNDVGGLILKLVIESHGIANKPLQPTAESGGRHEYCPPPESESQGYGIPRSHFRRIPR